MQQLDLLLTAQFYWKRNHELPRQPAVLRSLHFLYGVPELFSILPFLRGVFRQENLLPDQPLFFRVVMLYPIVIVVEAGTAQISGSGHSGASRAPADHLRFQMVNCHRSFTSFSFFCFSFVKEKMTRSRASGHSRKQSCRWQVCAGRSQAVSKTETTETCADDDSSARRCCGIVWRLSQQPQFPSESARLANGKYHRRKRAPTKSLTLWEKEAQRNG